MKVLLKLGAKIEECRRYVFNKGYNYSEADKYVREIFEETGFEYGLFDYIEKEEIEDVIEHLNNKILNNPLL